MECWEQPKGIMAPSPPLPSALIVSAANVANSATSELHCILLSTSGGLCGLLGLPKDRMFDIVDRKKRRLESLQTKERNS